MTTRIKLLLNLGLQDYPDSPLPEGEHEVSDVFAATLIARRLAVKLPPLPVKVAVVADKPAAPKADKPVEAKAEAKPLPPAFKPKTTDKPKE